MTDTLEACLNLVMTDTLRNTCLNLMIDRHSKHILKVGQTKFTVYRHKVFDFECGRVVIIQISNY